MLAKDRSGTETYLQAQYDYEPYGGVNWSWQWAGDLYDSSRTKYIGKEMDKESNLADHGVRKYENEVGVFTSIDPLWEEYSSWTPYQYAGNNPVMSVDWNGIIKLKYMSKSKKITVENQEINILVDNDIEYISLTDMIRAKDGDFFISDWLRNRNTIEYLGIWESVYNPNFNYGEFAIIKSQAGLNSYKLSVKEWVEQTNAIGIRATAGRYGGTYAHKDIAFEFGMWISPQFKIYLIKEFQRLKDEEISRNNLEWNLQRTLSKVNYQIHTDAIKENIIPKVVNKSQINFIYASEADMLNIALFGTTAKEWRDKNPDLEGNIRDYATLEQLVVLSNLESINALLIQQKVSQSERLVQLNTIAISQMKSLLNNRNIKKLK